MKFTRIQYDVKKNLLPHKYRDRGNYLRNKNFSEILFIIVKWCAKGSLLIIEKLKLPSPEWAVIVVLCCSWRHDTKLWSCIMKQV